MRGDRPKNPAALPWALRLLDTLSKLGVPQQIVDETGWRLNLDTLPLDQSPDLVAAHHARNISNLLMPSRAHQSTHAAPRPPPLPSAQIPEQPASDPMHANHAGGTASSPMHARGNLRPGDVRLVQRGDVRLVPPGLARLSTSMPLSPRCPDRPPGRIRSATFVPDAAGKTRIAPADRRHAFDHATRCGAKTRRGDACSNPAMRNGRCRMHGGQSPGAGTEQATRAAYVRHYGSADVRLHASCLGRRFMQLRALLSAGITSSDDEAHHQALADLIAYLDHARDHVLPALAKRAAEIAPAIEAAKQASAEASAKKRTEQLSLLDQARALLRPKPHGPRIRSTR